MNVLQTLLKTSFLAIVISLTMAKIYCQPDSLIWATIDEGLYQTEYAFPKKSSHGDSKLTAVKIDLTKFKFKLICASELRTQRQPAPLWCKTQNLIMAFNSGMFTPINDYKTSSGFMKNYDHTNNGVLNAKYKNISAFNRKDNSVPEFQIIDNTCQDWNVLKNKYNSFTQCLRIVDCNRKNVWTNQKKKWSMVCLAEDSLGKALVLFTRSPYSVKDFADMVLRAPLKIKKMMYLEGGPETSLYLDYNNCKIEKMGSYETGFNEDDNNTIFWGLPNVIGLVKR